MHAKDRSPPSLVRFGMRLVREMQRLEPFDRAMTLAAQAFTSIFPLVIAGLSILQRPDASWLGDKLADALALPDSTRASLSDALPDDSEQAATFGFIGLLIVLVSATSFSRALTRMYAKAWNVRGPGWTAPWRWIAVLVAISSCTVGLQVVQRVGADSTAGTVGALALTFMVSCVLWTWVPFILLAREVAWQMLAPAGVLTGVSTVVLSLASRVYMPRALEYGASKFGELGVAFTCIGWLFAVSFALITATVVGAVLAREPGPLARWLTPTTQSPATAAAAETGTGDA